MAIKRRRGFKIKQDYRVAENIAKRFNLIPELGRINEGRSSDIASILESRKALFDKSLIRDPEQAALLESLKSGLGGYTAQENTHLRESAAEEMNRTFQNAMRSLAVNRGSSGVRGAAAQAGALQLGTGLLDSQRGLERDLLVKNLEIQDQRKASLANFLSDLMASEYGRQTDSLSGLENLTRAAELDELGRTQFNIGQADKEQGLRGSVLSSLVGLRGNRRQSRKAIALEKARIAAEKEIAAQQIAAQQSAASEINALIAGQQNQGTGEAGGGI